MKKYFRRLMTTSAFRKSLFGYALTILLVTMIILGVMFGVLVADIKEYGVDHSQQLLRQLVQTSERVKSEVDNMISIITTESRTLQFVQSKTENKMDNFRLFLRLRETMAAYSYVCLLYTSLLQQLCNFIKIDPDLCGSVLLRLLKNQLDAPMQVS